MQNIDGVILDTRHQRYEDQVREVWLFGRLGGKQPFKVERICHVPVYPTNIMQEIVVSRRFGSFDRARETYTAWEEELFQ